VVSKLEVRPSPPLIDSANTVIRLRKSMGTAIRDARSREAKKAARGLKAANVSVTLDQIMAKLRDNNYRCAVSGLSFWNDDADRYGPTMPSIDRIDPSGDYSDDNTRVVLYGVNSLRGRGSDADMIRIAKAIAEHSVTVYLGSKLGAIERGAENAAGDFDARAVARGAAPDVA
jgi:hypothetical protein